MHFLELLEFQQFTNYSNERFTNSNVMTYTEEPDELIRLPIKHILGHVPRGCVCVFFLIDTIWTDYAGAESTLRVKWGSH